MTLLEGRKASRTQIHIWTTHLKNTSCWSFAFETGHIRAYASNDVWQACSPFPHKKSVECSLGDRIWPLHIVNTKGVLCCKDLIPSLNRAAKENSVSQHVQGNTSVIKIPHCYLLERPERVLVMINGGWELMGRPRVLWKRDVYHSSLLALFKHQRYSHSVKSLY